MRSLYLLIPLAILGGLYFFLQGPQGEGPKTPAGLDPEGEIAAPGPGVGAPGNTNLAEFEDPNQEAREGEPITDSNGVRNPLEIELVLLQPGSPLGGDKGEVRAGAKATLKGRLHDDRGNPLLGSVVFLAGSNRGREIFAAQDGTFLAGDLYPGLGIVKIQSGRGMTSEREVRLGQFGTTELNVAFGPRASAKVQGKVQNEKGEPLVGAKVRVDGQETLTDQEGQFRFFQTTAGRILVQVSAEGYAHYREELPLAIRANVEPGRLVFQLEPEAVLDLQVGGGGNPGEVALVYLFESGGQRVNTQKGQRTFPWHRVNPIQVKPGVGATVRGLPAGTVTVIGFQNGLTAKPVRTNVKLNSGRRSSAKLEFVPGPSLRGQVLLDGEPAGGARLRLEALDAHQVSMKTVGRDNYFANQMVIDVLPSADRESKANSQGRFVFTAPGGVLSSYVLWAFGPDGKTRGVRYLSKEELNSEVEIELRPIETGLGSVVLELPGVGQSVPYRVRINGLAREPLVVQAGDSILVRELPMGLWRMDAQRYGQSVVRGERFWVGDDQRVNRTLPLDEKLWAPRR